MAKCTGMKGRPSGSKTGTNDREMTSATGGWWKNQVFQLFMVTLNFCNESAKSESSGGATADQFWQNEAKIFFEFTPPVRRSVFDSKHVSRTASLIDI
jgi:hypothetical protein